MLTSCGEGTLPLCDSVDKAQDGPVVPVFSLPVSRCLQRCGRGSLGRGMSYEPYREAPGYFCFLPGCGCLC